MEYNKSHECTNAAFVVFVTQHIGMAIYSLVKIAVIAVFFNFLLYKVWNKVTY